MTVTLIDQATLTMAAIDPVGAQLISLKDPSGKEYIWQRDPAFWSDCSPLLFPSVGNCRDGRTLFEGVWYDMKKHGFCREAEFEVAQRTDSSAVFRLTSNNDTRRSYPYDFSLSLAYRLTGGILSMDYIVENRGSSAMHYCLGSHPGFNCPLEDGESFNDYMLEFEKEEHTRSVVYDLENLEFDPKRQGLLLDHARTLPLSYDLFLQDAVFFEQIASRKVSLIHQRTRKGVEVSYPGFETVAFWTPLGKNAPFLCIEPWNGSAVWADEDDDFTHRRHVQVLEPGSVRCHHLEIRILG